MWLYFNKDGQLLEALIHGGRARSGTTNFKIFAYFDNVDTSLYNLATIKLTKPDLDKTSYPALPMGNGTIRKQFELGEHEHSMCFKDEEYYTGFEFDFDNIDDDEDVAVLLDTPGLWEAVITLVGSNRVLNVQGLATFLVENGVVYEHGYEVSEEMIINQLYTLIATKLSARDSILRVDPDITPIDVGTHELGQVFYEINSDKSINRLSRIVEESGTRRLDPLYDFNAYYTKTYIDKLEAALRGFTTDKVGDEALARSNADSALSDRIDAKSTVSGTVQNNKWKTLTIDGETHSLGGGGATYTAGNGIEIENDEISIDDTVVATKTDLQTLATKTELQTYATSNDNRVGRVEGDVSNLTTRVRNAEDDIDILEVRVGSAESDIGIIEGKIPPQASSSNQLADKSFVNSSIATETATFRGTYNVVSDLGLTTEATEQQIASAIATKLSQLGITYDNNDYVYVAFPNATVSTQFDKYDRYKYSGSAWEYEYTLNNSSFTAEQWAAINSGITSGKVSSYDAHLSNTSNPHNVTKAQVGLGDVENKSTATIKSEFTGSISSGNTGFVTGGDVFTELGNYVDLDSAQTITGQKTFAGNILASGNVNIGSNASKFSDAYIKYLYSDYIVKHLLPLINNTYDIGTSNNKWKDLYLAGKIKDGTNSVSVADIKSGLAEANPTVPSGTTPIALTGIKVGSNYYDIESIKTQSTGGATSIQLKTWVGTQAQYDSITTKDANTQYIII